MGNTAEQDIGMDSTEEYVIEGRSTLAPDRWQFVGYNDEDGSQLNPCPTLDKALATVREMKETFGASEHAWDELRIVRKFTYTQVALVTKARVPSTIVRV